MLCLAREILNLSMQLSLSAVKHFLASTVQRSRGIVTVGFTRMVAPVRNFEPGKLHVSARVDGGIKLNAYDDHGVSTCAPNQDAHRLPELLSASAS